MFFSNIIGTQRARPITFCLYQLLTYFILLILKLIIDKNKMYNMQN